MSTKVEQQVWDHSQHSGTALLMLLAIARFANDQGHAWPAVSTLAVKCRMTDRNARMILKTLQDSQELEVVEGGGMATRHGKTNLFIIRLPGVGEGQDLKPASGVKNASGVKFSVARPEAGFRQDLKPASGRIVKEYTVNLLRGDVEARLEALGLYPSQVKTAIAAAVGNRHEFSLDDVAACEGYIARELPTFPKAVAALYNQYLRHGKLPPVLARTNGNGQPYSRAGPPLGEAPDITEDEAKRRGAALKAEILKGLPPNV